MKTLFKIYQIKDIPNVEYAFMGYDFAKGHNLYFGDYELVEQGVLESDNFPGSDWAEVRINMLEALFERYNIGLEQYPKGMHSLSVSDIVQLNDDYFYCDFSGWKKM